MNCSTITPALTGSTARDARFMARAIELARAPVRSVSPNPRVGALVVRDGRTVGEGTHHGPGTPHAEESALRAAGEAARGATLYCTLEPCSHSGPGKRRPPCAPLIVRAGIARVVIAHLDPNPAVRGEGARILADAGIDVRIGSAAAQALRLNAGFVTAMTMDRPFIRLKVAQSLDGRSAAEDGSSKWITDAAARARVHEERGECDAVLVGIGTVLADDPALTVRSGPARSPRPVVLDSRARIPLASRLVRDRAGELIVVVGRDADPARVAALRRLSVTVVADEEAVRPGVDAVLARLLELGVLSVYVEGGSEVVASFLASGRYDALSVYIAPLLLGGPRPALVVPAAPTLAQASRLEHAVVSPIGAQALVTGYRPGWWHAVEAVTLPQAVTSPQAADAGARKAAPFGEDGRVHGTR